MGRNPVSVLVVGENRAAVEAELVAGRLACPVCGGPLVRHGWARWRQVRTLDAERALRPRRAWCARCAATHVLLPAWAVPRRRDAAEVILAALVAKATGSGHRVIAVALRRPAATVRGWLRRAAARAEVTRVAATIWLGALEVSEPTVLAPTGSPVGDGLDALGSALAAARRRLGRQDCPGVLGLLAGFCAPDG